MKRLNIKLTIIGISIVICFFFSKFFLFGKLPIPADIISGMYYPFIDSYKAETGSMLPFKNYLIADPVRQTYVWKKMAIESLKNFTLPFWNPYSFAGSPLLVNFQTGIFYPANILFFIFSFNTAWGLYILLQPLLAAVFMFIFLINKRFDKFSSVVGAISFAFFGYMTAWMEWGNIGHTILWLPLLLYFIDKFFNKKNSKYAFLITFTLFLSFLAGYPQSFFYIVLTGSFYFISKLKFRLKTLSNLIYFILPGILYFSLALPILLGGIRFMNNSARVLDINDVLKRQDWFLPVQNLLQLFAPDFFGNPATLNYFGIWNYGEFVSYVGVVPLFFALYTLFYVKKMKKAYYFWLFLAGFSLLMALSNPLAKLPFLLNIPFLSTAQPSRTIVLFSYSLIMMAVYGIEYWQKNKKSFLAFSILGLIYVVLGLVAWLGLKEKLTFFTPENALVSLRNLIFPALLFSGLGIVLLLDKFIKRNVVLFIVVLLVFDMYRFFTKFNTFSDRSLIFPETKITQYLKKDKTDFRIMSVDRRIMPPNFSTYYKLQDVAGYDPLYLTDYASLISANESNGNFSNFSFNRIITPTNYKSKIFPLLNVKYILSLQELEDKDLELIFKEGETFLYENNNKLSRAFLVYKTRAFNEKNELGKAMFDGEIKKTAYIYNGYVKAGELDSFAGESDNLVMKHEENKVTINTKNENEAFLVLLDVFYPGWKATIDGQLVKIWQVDYAFRGVYLTPGEHQVVFWAGL